MEREIRVYRDKVWLSAEPKDKVLFIADHMKIDPEEALKRVLDLGYESWLAEHGASYRSDIAPP